jgi:murein DD-endopeptidase MepM/ murein hydrolase activator NlpD
MLAPISGTLHVSQGFGGDKYNEAYTVLHNGVQYHCIGHPGIDIACPVGTQVHAMKGGTVHFACGQGFPDDGYSPLGLHAVVTLPTGEQHWYGHLSSTMVNNGTSVAGGTVIALSGSTGNSTGPHVHVSVRPAKPDYNACYDGFECWLSHLDHDILKNSLDVSGV